MAGSRANGALDGALPLPRPRPLSSRALPLPLIEGVRAARGLRVRSRAASLEVCPRPRTDVRREVRVIDL